MPRRTYCTFGVQINSEVNESWPVNPHHNHNSLAPPFLGLTPELSGRPGSQHLSCLSGVHQKCRASEINFSSPFQRRSPTTAFTDGQATLHFKLLSTKHTSCSRNMAAPLPVTSTPKMADSPLTAPPFLRLPPKIRRRIYLYLGVALWDGLPLLFDLDGPPDPLEQVCFRGLLLSCRVLYAEASALLFSANRFIIHYSHRRSLQPLETSLRRRLHRWPVSRLCSTKPPAITAG